MLQAEDSRGRYSVFRIVEPGGAVLLRLSTDNRESAEQWCGALEAAGLPVLRSAGVEMAAAAAWEGAGGMAAAALRAQQDRYVQGRQGVVPEGWDGLVRGGGSFWDAPLGP